MVERGFRRAIELGNDALGQNLPELYSPLVEGIDLPDRALGEDTVLVKRDQLAERGRRQVAVDQDRVGWPVPLEEPVRNERLRSAFRLDLLCGVKVLDTNLGCILLG